MPGSNSNRNEHSGIGLCLLVATVFTLLNAIKPLQMDDPFYYQYARQIVDHPLDPYGFSLMYWNRLEPANHVLAPPVLPYWWAAGIHLFGERPFLWKLWLFPFSLALVLSLDRLLRRFAPGVVAPLLWLTVISPTYLPSLNLMLDVPAIALALVAIVVFLYAADRGSAAGALLAGLVAGLAIETKYTGVICLAVMLSYALLSQRLATWILAVTVGLVVFAGWEGFTAWKYGESHFLYHLQHGLPARRKLGLFVPLVTMLGSVAPALAVLGAGALRWPRKVAWGLATFIGLSFVVLIIGPDEQNTELVRRFVVGTEPITATDVLFGAIGLIVMGTWLSAARALAAHTKAAVVEPEERRQQLDTWFVIWWLGIEVAGYFALSPFPAVRRVLGIVAAATVLIGRKAIPLAESPRERRFINAVAMGGVALGLLFYTVDYRSADAEVASVRETLRRIGPRSAGATVWFTAYRAVQFYAERAGMKRIIPAGAPRPSVLQPGDWVMIMDGTFPQESVEWPADSAGVFAEFAVSDRLPLATLPSYYAGATPLRHHQGPRLAVTIGRFRADTMAVPRAESGQFSSTSGGVAH
jgi:4-amino-4-deoxy-L-arabinose transferase-like glycosyltransferase